jgi:hypothetical protein
MKDTLLDFFVRSRVLKLDGFMSVGLGYMRLEYLLVRQFSLI